MTLLHPIASILLGQAAAPLAVDAGVSATPKWWTWALLLSIPALVPVAAVAFRALYRRAVSRMLAATEAGASLPGRAAGRSSENAPPSPDLRLHVVDAESPWVRTIDSRRSALWYVYLAACVAALATLTAVALVCAGPLRSAVWYWAFAAVVPMLLTARKARSARLRASFSGPLAVGLAAASLLFLVAALVNPLRGDGASSVPGGSVVFVVVGVVYLALFALLLWGALRAYVGLAAWRVRRGRSSAETFSILLYWGAWATIAGVVTWLAWGRGPPLALQIALQTSLVLAAFLGVTTAGHAWARRRVLRGARFRLLVFRAFGRDRARRGLLERVANSWRYLGDVFLLTGTDLAATTMDPEAFRAFIARRLSSWFIGSEDQLADRIARIRKRPYSDGRFAVHEFPCFANTWRAVVLRLLTEVDAVLFDLRGYDRSHAGATDELRTIVDTTPAGKVVLVTDATTDEGLLDAQLRSAWSAMAASSPNRDARSGQLRTVRVGRASRRTVDLVLHALCEAASVPTGEGRSAPAATAAAG